LQTCLEVTIYREIGGQIKSKENPAATDSFNEGLHGDVADTILFHSFVTSKGEMK